MCPFWHSLRTTNPFLHLSEILPEKALHALTEFAYSSLARQGRGPVHSNCRARLDPTLHDLRTCVFLLPRERKNFPSCVRESLMPYLYRIKNNAVVENLM